MLSNREKQERKKHIEHALLLLALLCLSCFFLIFQYAAETVIFISTILFLSIFFFLLVWRSCTNVDLRMSMNLVYICVCVFFVGVVELIAPHKP